jgi:hypothetical protein
MATKKAGPLHTKQRDWAVMLLRLEIHEHHQQFWWLDSVQGVVSVNVPFEKKPVLRIISLPLEVQDKAFVLMNQRRVRQLTQIPRSLQSAILTKENKDEITRELFIRSIVDLVKNGDDWENVAGAGPCWDYRPLGEQGD